MCFLRSQNRVQWIYFPPDRLRMGVLVTGDPQKLAGMTQ